MIYSGKFKVTSPFGMRTLDGVRQLHKGIDVVGITDKHICAVVGGVVGSSTIITDRRSKTAEWGHYVRVDGDDGLTYYYCHMDKRLVRKGQRVKAGDHLGVEGMSGVRADGSPSSTGAHCHFEVRRAGKSIDPTPYLGVDNKAGTYGDDYRAKAQQRFGFDDDTMAMFDKHHPYPAALFKKLATAK